MPSRLTFCLRPVETTVLGSAKIGLPSAHLIFSCRGLTHQYGTISRRVPLAANHPTVDRIDAGRGPFQLRLQTTAPVRLALLTRPERPFRVPTQGIKWPAFCALDVSSGTPHRTDPEPFCRRSSTRQGPANRSCTDKVEPSNASESVHHRGRCRSAFGVFNHHDGCFNQHDRRRCETINQPGRVQ